MAQMDDEDDSSVISVSSDPSSDGDGHSECRYAGLGYCLDDDHFTREREDPEGTVMDVLNINRKRKRQSMNHRDFLTPRGAQRMGLRLASQTWRRSGVGPTERSQGVVDSWW